MILNIKDLYTYEIIVPLTVKLKNGSEDTVGTTVIHYEIKRYKDVRNLNPSLKDTTLAYQILCTQRIIIPNSTPYKIGPSSNQGFYGYPAAITSFMNVMVEPIELVNYSPRTINAAVTTSASTGSGSTSNTTRQHTSGSTTSQSNSFGASASVGFSGGLPTADVSANYEHSSGSDISNSSSGGSDTGNNTQHSSSESMSVKDWACYSYLHNDSKDPKKWTPNLVWVWGQEYPWNVLIYNNGQSSTSNITLPTFVSSLLQYGSQSDGSQAPSPPSQLSLYGVDFTMKSVWIVKVTDDIKSTGEIPIQHVIQYCTASHSVSGSSSVVNATLENPQSFAVPLQSVDLYSYGLDPISNMNSNPIIGFIPNKFIVKPQTATAKGSGIVATPFKIISSDNNLMISDTTDYSKGKSSTDVGAGFSASETALTANFTASSSSFGLPLQITMQCKIIDTSNNYTLFMKHWQTNNNGVMLTILINDDITATTPNNKIVKYVDALEAEGGENNLLSIALRNQGYGTVDYHDYLQLGMNKFQITITPMGKDCGYQIRAISIEKS